MTKEIAPSDHQRASRSSGCRTRFVIERLVALGIVALVVRTWFCEGWFFPLVIPSGSMAETLMGPHRHVVCRDCGHAFVCGDEGRLGPRAVCPNCGYPKNDVTNAPTLAGDRLLVGKTVFCPRGIRRWDLVTFRCPHDARQRCIKRVVGLPGESILLHEGDVFVDGKIQRKPLWRQRTMAISVYDADQPPRLVPTPPPRWQGQRPDSSWGSAGGRFAHAAAPDESTIDWLIYTHHRRLPGRPGKASPVPIHDGYGYNQSLPLRVEDSHAVTDLLLSFRLLEMFGSGRLWIRVHDGHVSFHASLDRETGRCKLFRDGTRLLVAEGKWPRQIEEPLVEFSSFDRQILLAVAGQVVIDHACTPPKGSHRPSSQPLALGAQGVGLRIGQLRIARDIYYMPPPAAGVQWGCGEPFQLRADEYYVLGDNSPLSQDSRTWPEGAGVGAKLMLGKPFLVFPPAKRIELGSWVFHVPDPTKIRYIY